MCFHDGAVIRVTFSPVRQHGVAVRNECSVSVSLARLASEDVRSTIVLKWQNQIAQMIEAAQVGAMPILAQQAEQQARKSCSPPSPETYARRVAMKYGPNGTEGGMQT